MRNARRDEDEIAGLVLDALDQPVAVLVPHAPFEDVQHHLEADVDVRAGHAARRNDATFIDSCVAPTFFPDIPSL